MELLRLEKFFIRLFAVIFSFSSHRYFYTIYHGSFQEETKRLLNEHNEFKVTARETGEKVKLLMQLAESIAEKRHTHAATIQQWVTAVDKTYKHFSARMERYRVELEKNLGIEQKSTKEAQDHAAAEAAKKFKEPAKHFKELNEEKRRSARRKE